MKRRDFPILAATGILAAAAATTATARAPDRAARRSLTDAPFSTSWTGEVLIYAAGIDPDKGNPERNAALNAEGTMTFRRGGTGHFEFTKSLHFGNVIDAALQKDPTSYRPWSVEGAFRFHWHNGPHGVVIALVPGSWEEVVVAGPRVGLEFRTDLRAAAPAGMPHAGPAFLEGAFDEATGGLRLSNFGAEASETTTRITLTPDKSPLSTHRTSFVTSVVGQQQA